MQRPQLLARTNSLLQKIPLLGKFDCVDVSKGRLVAQHLTIDKPHHAFFHQSLKYQEQIIEKFKSNMFDALLHCSTETGSFISKKHVYSHVF